MIGWLIIYSKGLNPFKYNILSLTLIYVKINKNKINSINLVIKAN